MDLATKERLIRSELEEALDLLAFDATRFSTHVCACLDIIHARLFDPDLSVGSVYAESASNSHGVGLQFRQELDVGMREYIENARLLAAMRLFAYDELELYLIASSVGYVNYETFSRAFKRRVGHAPSTFRAIYTESALHETVGRKRQPASSLPAGGSLQRSPTRPDAPRPVLAVLHSQSVSPTAGAIMQITDVRGLSSDNHSLDCLEVEGCAPDADKVQVTIEVTGKTLSKTVSVRKDETWSVSFKGTGKTDLSGFACGALVGAEAVASGDQTQHVSWKGCLSCRSDDDNRDAASEVSGDSESQANAQNGAPADSPARQSASGEPLVVVEQHASPSGDALVTVRVAESSEAVAYRPSRSEASRYKRGSDEDEVNTTSRDRGVTISRPQERPDETRLAPSPEQQDHARNASTDPEGEEQRAQKSDEDDEQDTPKWLGALLALSEAGFLVAVAAQSYPIILGVATAFMLTVTAYFLANQPPRSWALWTLGALGLAAVAIAGMLPFFDFVGFDVYLLSAGLAASGLAAGAGLLMFTSDDA